MLKIPNKKTVLTGMAFSVGLEILQFILAVGATDITDVITNTAGTVMGVGVYSLLLLGVKKRENLDKVLCVLASICTILMVAIISLLLFAN